MGIFDALFRRRPAISTAPETPDDVRRLLFDAVGRGDVGELAKLAATNEAVILEHFGAWQKVPEAVRGDPSAMQTYAHGLIALAQHFVYERGMPVLMEQLTGGARNPVLSWQRALGESDQRMEQGDFAGAVEVLRGAIESTQGLTGNAVDEYLPKTQARLGVCLFHLGDTAGALPPLMQALEGCRRQGDHEGVSAYLESLYEIHRYRGEAEDAARCLEERATLREQLGERAGAERDGVQAKIVRAGEPLCRLQVEVSGKILELDEVTSLEGGARFLFTRNRQSRLGCTRAIDEGVSRGDAGDFEGALAAFRRAANEDAFDPWPSYHAGVTLLHLHRPQEAVASYAKTEELAPGWYHCRADRWMAEQLAAGTMDHAQFELVRGLVDGEMPPERALLEARRGIERQDLGVLRLMAGKALQRLGRRSEAEAEYRQGLNIAEEPDIRTRLLTALGGHLADGLERHQLLAEAGALQGNLVAAAAATLLLRQTAS